LPDGTRLRREIKTQKSRILNLSPVLLLLSVFSLGSGIQTLRESAVLAVIVAPSVANVVQFQQTRDKRSPCSDSVRNEF
jgi:hypothetical protein